MNKEIISTLGKEDELRHLFTDDGRNNSIMIVSNTKNKIEAHSKLALV